MSHESEYLTFALGKGRLANKTLEMLNTSKRLKADGLNLIQSLLHLK